VHSARSRQPSWRNVPNSRIVKVQDGGGRHIGFRKIYISGLDEDISTKFGRHMHHGYIEMITLTEIETGS